MTTPTPHDADESKHAMAGATAEVSPSAREELRHTPEGEPPARMLLPKGLAILMGVLVAVVVLVSVIVGLTVDASTGVLAGLIGLVLVTVANPVVWAAILRVREHDRAQSRGNRG